VEISLWKRLWTCRKTDYLNEMNIGTDNSVAVQEENDGLLRYFCSSSTIEGSSETLYLVEF
jgi:hypothetical protein